MPKVTAVTHSHIDKNGRLPFGEIEIHDPAAGEFGIREDNGIIGEHAYPRAVKET